MESNLIEKIRKLLAMAKGGTEHEARTAAALAARLMAEHDIDAQTVSGAHSQKQYTSETSESFSRRPMEHKYLYSMIREHYSVAWVITSPTIEGQWKRGYAADCIGSPEAVTIALYVLDFLTVEFKRLWKEYKRHSGAPAAERGPFYYGLAAGLNASLREQKAAIEDERGLVIVRDGGINKARDQKYPRLGRSSGMNVNSGRSTGAGRSAGAGINIRSGISGRAGRRLLS